MSKIVFFFFLLFFRFGTHPAAGASIKRALRINNTSYVGTYWWCEV